MSCQFIPQYLLRYVAERSANPLAGAATEVTLALDKRVRARRDIARKEVTVRKCHAGDARRVAPATLGPFPQWLERYAALTRDFDPALEGLLRVRNRPGHVLVVRVHPELAAGGLDDRSGEPIVIRVGVGADDQVDVREPVAGLSQRSLQLFERAGLVDPGVHQHQPITGANRIRIDVGNARPGKRKAQAPDAWEDTVGPSELTPSVAHGGEATSVRRTRDRR